MNRALRRRPAAEYNNYYGKAGLLYYYMFFAPERSGQMARDAALRARGKSPTDAGPEAFGDLGTLQRELVADIHQRTMPSLALTADKLIVGPIAVRTLSDGEAAAIPWIVRSRLGVDGAGAAEVVAKARLLAAK